MRHDPTRLAELRRLLILDSAPERDFDRITETLAASLEVPIAIVNFLDQDRDWFKSCVGLPLRESPAATSFCESFLVSDDDLIHVEDTTLDDRFRDHPLVVGAPFVRFYAAARLVVGGQTVGTLCAYDFKPRRIAPDRVAQVQALAGAVLEVLQRRSPAGVQQQR